MNKGLLILVILGALGTTAYGRDREIIYTDKGRVVVGNVEKIEKDTIVGDMVVVKDNNNVSISVNKKSGYYDDVGKRDELPQIELNIHKSEQDDKQTEQIEHLQETKVDRSEFDKIKSTLNISDLENGVRANSNSIVENKIAQDRVNEEHKSQLEELNTKTNVITHSIEQSKEEQKIVDNKQTSNIAINSQKIEENKATQDKVNQYHRAQLEVHDNRIANLEQKMVENSNKIDKLSDKLDAVGAMSSAMSSVAFGELREGEVAIGVGYGFFNDTNAVAVGVATGMTNDITVNAKVSATNGHHSEYSASCGVVYKWSFK